MFDLTRSTSIIMALFGGLFAILYAYRKQRVDEAAGHRADDEALLGRYQSAAEQLGHDQAAVRLAGVYAMAHLADDWPQQRQTCVDVLCAYLRMPLPQEEELRVGEREVRMSIQNLIRAHLVPGPHSSWSDLTFDFTNAPLHGLDMRNAVFNTRPNFFSAFFTGWCSFENASFARGAVFSNCVIDCKFLLKPLSFESRIDLLNARVTSKTFTFECSDTRADVLMESMEVSGRMRVDLKGPGTDEDKCLIRMSRLKLVSGSALVKVGGGPSPTNLFLLANNWKSSGESHINVRSRFGRGNKPVTAGIVSWDLGAGTASAEHREQAASVVADRDPEGSEVLGSPRG